MLYTSTPTLPAPAPSGSPGELAATLVRAQMTMAGGFLRWGSESAGFLTSRLQKEAEMWGQLAAARSPTEATTLVLRHAQSTWADYAAHGMKLGAMLAEEPEKATDLAASALPVPQPEAAMPAAPPRVPAAPAKSTRSDPV